ncbi:MAG: GIY-YIG nuclease family protein [bacterium]|nr:GIY-YIG nuclease family protein [bacterium]
MFYVYVLKSDKDHELYIGSTDDLQRRIRAHQQGHSFSTSFRLPFALVYYEAYRNERDARTREQRLKLRGQARRHLLARILLSIEGE